MQLAEIRLYPIKSCAGISVDSALLEPRGFAGDRRYMLVDERGRFLTQRVHPQMSRIRVSQADGGWAVEAPGQETRLLPASLPAGPQRAATVWGDTLKLTEADPSVNRWFSAALDMPCRLVNMTEGHLRRLKPGRGRNTDQVSLADGAPVLLTATASLAQLNERLPRPVGMVNFRPNLVAATTTAFEEDEWHRIRIGSAEFDVAWACTRCVLTTIDPETAKKDPDGEPIRTLKTFRRGPEGVMFGQNVIPRRLGTVSVGDPIDILSRDNEDQVK